MQPAAAAAGTARISARRSAQPNRSRATPSRPGLMGRQRSHCLWSASAALRRSYSKRASTAAGHSRHDHKGISDKYLGGKGGAHTRLLNSTSMEGITAALRAMHPCNQGVLCQALAQLISRPGMSAQKVYTEIEGAYSRFGVDLPSEEALHDSCTASPPSAAKPCRLCCSITGSSTPRSRSCPWRRCDTV